MNILSDGSDFHERIDAVCVQFARELRTASNASTTVSIELLLAQHSDLPRHELLKELLREELEFLQQRGQHPSADDLQQRFPQDSDVIAEVLSSARAGVGVANDDRTLAADLPRLEDSGPPANPSGSREDWKPQIAGFQIFESLGKGGMGVVYRAIDHHRRQVALKVLPHDRLTDRRAQERFNNEIYALGRLRHPNIVQVHESGHRNGEYFYSMDYIRGQNLAALIRAATDQIGVRKAGASAVTPPLAGLSTQQPNQSGSSPKAETASGSSPHLPEGAIVYPSSDFLQSFIGRRPSSENRRATAAVVQIGIDVAEALHYAHESGVTHRDLKPANLLLDVTGRVWVADFGLAQVDDGAALTMEGEVLGTWRYMSPEQLMGGRVIVDSLTDIYSLGVTLYELLSLSPARDGKDRGEVRNQVAFGDPVPLRQRNPAIPRDLETIIHRAIAYRPKDRYQTMQELAADLRRFQRREPIQAKPAGPLKRFSLWVEREQKLAASLAASAALLLVILGLLLAFVNTLRIHNENVAAQESAAKNTAQQQAKEAEAGRLVAWSHERRNFDPALAERLAITSAKQLPTAEASAAIILAMRQNHEIRSWSVHNEDSLVDGFVLNPDRTRVVIPTSIRAITASNILGAPEYDLTTGTHTRDYGGTGHVVAAKWSPDGKYLATVELLGESEEPLYNVEIRIWPPDNATPITIPRLLSKPLHIDQLSLLSEWPLELGHLNTNTLHLVTTDGTSNLKFFTVPQGIAVEPIDLPSITSPVREIAIQTPAPSSGLGQLAVLDASGLLTVCRLGSTPAVTRHQLPPNDRSTRITRLTTLRSGLTIAQFGSQLLLSDIPMAEERARTMRASSFHVSRDESRILVVDNGDQSKLIDAQTGTTLADQKHDTLLNLATLSDDGSDSYFTYIGKESLFQTSLPGSYRPLPSPRSVDTESGLLVAQEFIGENQILQLTQTGRMTTLSPAPQSGNYTLSTTADGSLDTPYCFDAKGPGICVCETPRYFTLQFHRSRTNFGQLLQGRQLGPHAVNSTVAALTDARTAVITYFSQGAVRKQSTIRLPTNSIALFPATTETSFVLTEEKQLLKLTHGLANYHPLTMPEETVTAVSWNPTQNSLCFSCKSGEIRLYSPDAATDTAHQAPSLQIITALAQSPDGRTITAADSTGRLSVLSRTDETFTEQFTAGDTTVQAPDRIILSPDSSCLIAFAGRGKSRRIKHFNTKDSTTTMSDEYSGQINAFPLPDDKWLIASSEGLTEWSPKLQTSKQMVSVKIFAAGVLGNSIASLEPRYNTDPNIVNSATSINAIPALQYVLCLRSIDTLAPLHELKLPGVPDGLAVDQFGDTAHITLNRFPIKHFASGQNTPTARLLLDSRPKMLCSLTESNQFACVTEDGNFHIWNPNTDVCKSRRIVADSIVSVAHSPNGHRFCAITSKGSLVWWQSNTDDVRELSIPNPQQCALIITDHTDDTLLINREGRASLISHSQSSHDSIITPLEHRTLHARPVISTGQFLVVTAVGSEYELSLVPSRPLAKTLKLTDLPDAIAVSTDGVYCLLRIQGKTLHLYKAINSSFQLDRIIENPDMSESIRFEFSNDGLRWIAVSRKGVTVVSTETLGSEFFIPSAATRPLFSLSFYQPFSTPSPLLSPDNRRLIQPETSLELWPVDLSSVRNTANSRVLSDRERRVFGIRSLD